MAKRPPLRAATVGGIFVLLAALVGAGGAITAAEINVAGETQKIERRVDEADALQAQLEAQRNAACPIILTAVGHQANTPPLPAAEPERRLLDEGARRCIGLLPAPKDLPELKVESRP